MNFEEIGNFIATATKQDLDRMGNLMNARRDMIAQIHKSQFNSGDIVEFEDKRGNTIRGQISAINRKNLKIRSDLGTNWTVYPCFVRLVE